MRADLYRNLKATAAAALGVSLLTACQAERAVVAPAEPTWSYRDGQAQFSNNAAWEQMVPATAALPLDTSKVASVEDPTRASD